MSAVAHWPVRSWSSTCCQAPEVSHCCVAWACWVWSWRCSWAAYPSWAAACWAPVLHAEASYWPLWSGCPVAYAVA
ncbi:hypothetical protein V6574_22345 [Streptomyces sp. SM1P]